MRSEKRTEIDEAARLHPNNWSSIEVRLLDISTSGFRAECEARILAGSAVTLEIEGIGGVAAHVTWRRGSRFGAKFDVPVELSRCNWSGVAAEAVLSRMLVERAEARQAGAFGQELELRRKILQSLPMQRLEETAPRKRRAAP